MVEWAVVVDEIGRVVGISFIATNHGLEMVVEVICVINTIDNKGMRVCFGVFEGLRCGSSRKCPWVPGREEKRRGPCH